MLSNLEYNNVNNVYNHIAEHFNVTRVNKWYWVTEFLNNFKKNSLIVDLGCGNGRNMDYENLNFIGVDNCSKFVDICKDKNYNVINSNITSVNLESNIADGIICIAVFHHLSTIEHRIDALKEMKRILKPGCKLLLSVWSIINLIKLKDHLVVMVIILLFGIHIIKNMKDIIIYLNMMKLKIYLNLLVLHYLNMNIVVVMKFLHF